MLLKEGWLNRQFDQVSKNVDSWPDWMKRAAGFEENRSSEVPENSKAQVKELCSTAIQPKLNLK